MTVTRSAVEEHGTEALRRNRDFVDDDSTAREAWGPPLLEAAEARATQELAPLGGSCAHIRDEQIVAKIDDATGEFWLRGRFRFVMYRHPPPL